MLVIKEMQVTTALRFHLTPVRMIIFEKQQMLARMLRKRNTYSLLVGVEIGTTTTEISMEVPLKIKNRTST